ncbi:hypothetical protein Pres01_56220 [Metapseudomonas resinovorans]|nr:hypothetical protein Pres01_56220 [Pseudomonas resinovorans]
MHTGQLEGINNRIKVIKRMAYGYRDSDFFFMKIKAAFPGNPWRTFFLSGGWDGFQPSINTPSLTIFTC